MINPLQFRELIVRPTLKAIKLWSQSAENLIVGTAIQESRLTYVKQLNGPAVGIMQIEPATYDSICQSLEYRRDLRQLALDACNMTSFPKDSNALVGNMVLSVIFARILYYFDKEKLPAADDINALGQYYKRVYNTYLGAAKVEDFVTGYKRYAIVKQA